MRAPRTNQGRPQARPGVRLLAKGSIFGVMLLLAGALGYALPLLVKPSAMRHLHPEDIAHQGPIRATHGTSPNPTDASALVSPSPSDGLAPRASIPRVFHDFGTVRPSQVVSTEFVVGNDGQAPLMIRRAYTTCGCTTADVSASTIPPGKVALVVVWFDARAHPDAAGTTLRRALILETNDPYNPRLEIWIQASIRAGP